MGTEQKSGLFLFVRLLNILGGDLYDRGQCFRFRESPDLFARLKTEEKRKEKRRKKKILTINDRYTKWPLYAFTSVV